MQSLPPQVGGRRIYLDHSATTPVDPRVAAAMARSLTETYGNPSSVHGFGQQARAAVDRARREVAALIGAKPNEIVFTSGGTEANNLAIRGVCEAAAAHSATSSLPQSNIRPSGRLRCARETRLGNHAAAGL